MLWKTHLLIGAAAGVAVASHGAGEQAALVSAGVAGLAALLPDIDSPYSTVGRIVPIIPRLLNTCAGHRGPFHSLLFTGLFTAAFAVLVHANLPLCASFFAGYVSHLIMDALNPQRVPLLWPLKARVGIGIVNPCGALERYVVMPAAFLCFVWLAFPLAEKVLAKKFL